MLNGGKMVDFTKARQLTQNKWSELLPQFGIESRFLVNQHGPCPICGGKDRFRFDDRGSGSYFCSGCGAGDGFDLLFKAKGMTMLKVLSEARLLPDFAPNKTDNKAERNKMAMKRVWETAEWVRDGDAVSTYLKLRGIDKWPPNCFRIAKSIFHKESNNYYHAMLAKVCGPDGRAANVHITYLNADGSRPKIEPNKKVMAGTLPAGSVIKLFPHNGIIGIAEGIETALSCSQMFGVPTWAAINANMLSKWIPPEGTKKVYIYGDNDDNYTGHAKAYQLAHSLKMRNFDVLVHFPDMTNSDFNDVLKGS
jgi:putative DNA primase/helicase